MTHNNSHENGTPDANQRNLSAGPPPDTTPAAIGTPGSAATDPHSQIDAARNPTNFGAHGPGTAGTAGTGGGPNFDPVIPAPPNLNAAADHRAAAENAAARRDFDQALRERFRAVLRALEQGGALPVRRSRTAQETANEAVEQSGELHPAALSFDEVVYGGRQATEDEYRRLEYADRYSQSAPPPKPEAAIVEITESAPKKRRALPPLPALLRSPKFWAVVAACVALAILVLATTQSCGAPTAPKPPVIPDAPDLPPPDSDEPWDWGAGHDSILAGKPPWLIFGGLQLLIAFGIFAMWRGRRRGALVGEPLPVEIPANELLGGQAGLYRRSRDYEYVARILRDATMRRIRTRVTGGDPATIIASRLSADPTLITSVLTGPVPDEATLYHVAAHLEWIETEL
ncbi:DUF4129 domain-containing protein [Nocardia camponoti]|uniref:Protein-glutamine gamma-glutamyltransferase-like C-terminal domain-containing protein n=1 Tax=Nocardia camponoti TaxID=1616106 RepID=A0A917VAF0_9NOCA|nr:DUF4129 domain-containing protein [Nocardia camponoti]GGK54976.1 hypothetical protein GCM10011591_28590 [Nocardia camponoti]